MGSESRVVTGYLDYAGYFPPKSVGREDRPGYPDAMFPADEDKSEYSDPCRETGPG